MSRTAVIGRRRRHRGGVTELDLIIYMSCIFSYLQPLTSISGTLLSRPCPLLACLIVCCCRAGQEPCSSMPSAREDCVTVIMDRAQRDGAQVGHTQALAPHETRASGSPSAYGRAYAPGPR